MKNVFMIIKKKHIAVMVVVLLGISIVAGFFEVKKVVSPKPEYTIVIDAGHGGRDGGAVGVSTGVTESELNLQYALTLKEICEEFGVGVVMTRSDMNGLYDEGASNKKRSEMERRREIINSSGADLMISIHMNSFPLSSCKGAYVFYGKGKDDGFELAKSIQNALCLGVENARDYVTVGDYFVLNTSHIPSALIECGFLSNPQEEQSLLNDDYRIRVCYSVMVGILSYFKIL